MSVEQITGCIRAMAADVVQGPKSGHPGAPMGMAPVASVLFSEVMKFNAKDSQWFNRDRFVLSNGHASALLYTMLHLCGYKVTIEDLKAFRKMGSVTPGHPERGITDGVEVTTGPLGQGLSNAVGMAIAESQMAATFNKDDATIVDHHTYVFCGDGCLMEGVGMEALSLAGHLALSKLIVVYDDNKITIDGSTDVAFTEDTAAKYAAMGFNIITVADGDRDFAAIRKALTDAKACTTKPTMIMLRTTIGLSSKMEGTAKVHGSPLGDEDIKNVKIAAGRNPDNKYFVEEEVQKAFKVSCDKGIAAQDAWNGVLKSYAEKYPEDHAVFQARLSGKLPTDFKDKLPRNGASIATRKASENTLGELLTALPQLMGGSADLTGSNLTRPGQAALVDYQKGTPEGRYFRFGVREHGMAGIMNGMHAHGGCLPFGGTFLNFISYALGSVRLAAMSHHQVIYVATHDSIGLGEDGPTHQPTELLASLRALPNFQLMRPSDQTETSACWALAMESAKTPSCLCLTRQSTVPQNGSSFDGVYHGAYSVVDVASPELIIAATGSEVGLAVEAAEILASKLKVRVVSMPCWAVYDKQSEEYKNSVFTEGVPVISVEAYHAAGWLKYSHYHVGMESWGASAPAPELYEAFGITASNVAAKGEKLAAVYGSAAPKKRLVL